MTDGLLDTTLFIDVRRGQDAASDSLWDSIRNGDRTASFSPVTAYELWVGRLFSREEEILFEAMFAVLEPVPLSVSAAKTAGIWLRSSGERQQAVFRDALIGASALERGEKVVTRNVEDFIRFPGVEVESY